MKIRDWKIGQWLLSGFTIILIFVVGLGVVSYSQAKKLNLQTEVMYEHPLAVRRSIDTLKLDISELRTELRNYILATNSEEEDEAILSMELLLVNAERQFDVLNEKYLGSPEDIEETYKAFVLWSSIRERNIKEIEAGKVNIVLASIAKDGEEANMRDQLLDKIAVIDNYATNKSDELYHNSTEFYREMRIQLIIIVSTLFLVITTIGIWIYRNFKDPLTSMNETVQKLQMGHLGNRVEYLSENELGVLAKSFNDMADVIEGSEEIHMKINKFSEVLISENEKNRFFRVVLKSLMKHTNSISSVIYLLDEERESYVYFDSIALDKENFKNYSLDSSEGDIGKTLLEKKLNIVKIDGQESLFSYNSVIAGILPKEIMNIPLFSNGQIHAIISLASTSSFDKATIDFIKRILVNLNSKTETVLANEKISTFVSELEERSSELVTQNSELEIQKKQLAQASKLKSNFLSNMSHELRTPLNSVIALSGILYEKLQGEIPNDEYSYLEIIQRNGKNLLKIINDILDISRIESGKIELEISRFNINSLIIEILAMFEVGAREKGIELINSHSNNEIYIESDYDKCLHIIQNLVSNAVKFTSEGSVSIELLSHDRNIEIKIEDTGIGIASENISSIFEEFKQADSGTSRRFGGTGLGLSIASKFTNMLGGELKVESKLGLGTTFRLLIPKKNNIFNDVEVEVEVRSMDKNIDSYTKSTIDLDLKIDLDENKRRNILLIEDNESTVLQLKELVKGMDVGILIAKSGEEGLDLLSDYQVDAIILDIMMPGIDGFEVLQEVRNDESTFDIPVLVLTAKQITSEELSMLRKNNIYQLIQKGDIDRLKLQTMIFDMLFEASRVETKRLDKKRRPTILVVEDNEDNVTTIKALLSDYADLIIAVDGEQGIEYAIEHKPELILMDIALPKINGIEAFQEIRKFEGYQDIPIIAVSASALEEEREGILAYGFDDFVSKPINLDELLKSIERVLFND